MHGKIQIETTTEIEKNISLNFRGLRDFQLATTLKMTVNNIFSSLPSSYFQDLSEYGRISSRKEATGRKDASRSMRLDARPEVLGVSAYYILSTSPTYKTWLTLGFFCTELFSETQRKLSIGFSLTEHENKWMKYRN